MWYGSDDVMKYLTAIVVFLLAVALQLWFAPGGMRGDFVLAVLIVFAFLFDAWIVAFFSVAAAFLLDPASRPGVELSMFLAVPFAIFFLRRKFFLDPWLSIPIGIVLGIGALYAVVAPAAMPHSLPRLALDAVICALFGEVVWYGMEG